MTTATDPQGGGFRLSQLIYDTRYRSITIQFVALVLILTGISILLNNMVQNLEALGRDFDFGFLGQRAGYDIGFSLISYDSSDSHGRAAVVGMLNTILVAIMGIILATIIGVIAGVLRLSKNWIVNKLMAVYVEGFRNVPLLLWIFLIFAIVTEATPQPSDFRLNDAGVADASMMFADSVAVTNRGTYVPGPVMNTGGWLTIAVFIASVIGIIAWRRYARRQLYDHGRLVPVLWPAIAILIVPTLIAYLLFTVTVGAPITLDYPELGGFNFRGGVNVPNSLLALTLALALYTGAFIAEIVRAGILAVSKGQSEAAFALGIKPSRTMNLVILPQALRVIIPPLTSQYLNLTKNSSLAIAVGFPDVRATLGGTAITTTGKELEGMLLLGLFFLILSFLIATAMNAYNNSKKLQER